MTATIITVGEQFITSPAFPDYIVIDGTWKIAILNMIRDHFAVGHMHFLPSPSEQIFTIGLPDIA